MSIPPDRLHFFDLTPETLAPLIESWGMPRYRATQLLDWVYRKHVADPQQMTNFALRDRQLLAERLVFTSLRITEHQRASDGTQKLLLELEARNSERGTAEPGVASSTECVMIPSQNPDGAVRRTACISSQVGCPVGCRFCASGLGGLEKNLTTGQIVEQVWWLNGLPELAGGRGITNVVFMGMGEPLANFANVTRAIRTLAAPWGVGISARKITVSTVGLPKAIEKLADEMDLPITLAISLHAPNDALRRQLIPWAEYTTVHDLVAAGQHYFDRTGREFTLEYILLRNVNDRPEHAHQLAALARRMRCNVNLIRYNEVKGLPFNRPDSEDVQKFQQVLRDAGVNSHIRASRGRDIAAACGQLRHESAPSASGR